MSPQPMSGTSTKPDGSTYGAYSTTPTGTPGLYPVEAEPVAPQKRNKTICGCTFLVFVLSVTIAVLAAAVIGLAAGTGLEASRANEAAEKLSALQSSISATPTATTTSASATATSFASLTNNCSNKDETTTGQTYTTDCKSITKTVPRSTTDFMTVFGKKTFTMFCNTNAPNPPLMSLFTANFNNCMDACAAFNSYEDVFSGNATCDGVSFIPLWTTRSGAVEGKAPGNCYLKPGPQTRDGLETPNIGTECHAAIMSAS